MAPNSHFTHCSWWQSTAHHQGNHNSASSLSPAFHIVPMSSITLDIEKAFLAWEKIPDPSPSGCPVLQRSKTAESHNSESTMADSSYQLLPLHHLPNPPKKGNKLGRYIRYSLFTPYRRLWIAIVLPNIVGAILSFLKFWQLNIDSVSTWASTNFLVAVLVRQDFFINLLFRTAWLVPLSTPLPIRKAAVRVYTYGGIHSGSAVSGTVWWLLCTTDITAKFVHHDGFGGSILGLTWTILILLLTICLFACPHLRAALHNTFELTHRLAGWTVVLLFWVELFLLSYQTHKTEGISLTYVLVTKPTFWNLLVMTILLIIPWLSLRKWEFTPQKLSNHAVCLHFSKPIRRFDCLVLSSSPLREWHSFATFPIPQGTEANEESKYSSSTSAMVISNAGDWTNALMSSSRTSYWIKGIPKPGVLSLTVLFRRVVIVTTGSGIGPCLSSLIHRRKGQECRLIWSSRRPRETFGDDMLHWVRDLDPKAKIIDSAISGRPDLARLAWEQWIAWGAEAVFVLSNMAVTTGVVRRLEGWGVPAYGPIFDS